MKAQSITAHPLVWPEGWPRTMPHLREQGTKFVSRETVYRDNLSWQRNRPITFDRARKLLVDELDRLKAKAVIISSNIPLRNDGLPRADAAERRLNDPGIAVYFSYKGKAMVMACDRFISTAANIRSLGLAIDAMRSLERHGGGMMMERAFAGFSALPPPEGSAPKRPWWTVLNYGEDPETRADLSVEEVEARFRVLAKRRHPDVTGGSVELMTELNEAREEAVRDLGG